MVYLSYYPYLTEKTFKYFNIDVDGTDDGLLLWFMILTVCI